MRRASAIVFDIDDTLYDLSWPYREAFAEVFADRHDLPVSELFKVSRVHSDEALELLTAGKITPEDHKVLRVQWTFADYGVDVSREEALRFQEAYARAQQHIQPYPEALEMLRAVADSGVKMGALSNGDAEHQLDKVRLLGIDRWIDPANIVISGDHGENKPAVALFDEVSRRLGEYGTSVWYVGDTYETDIVGAKRAGWSCLWLDCRGRAVPDVEERPDLVVHTPAQMRDAVCELVEA